MAKSMTVGKRENEKKRIAKREEKLKKKENKKLSGSSNSFEDMIAYVDENGRITSTPPTENVRKEEINPDEIVIATPKKEDEEPTILRGPQYHRLPQKQSKKSSNSTAHGCLISSTPPMKKQYP